MRVIKGERFHMGWGAYPLGLQTAPGADPLRYPLILFKRWFGSQTLTWPDPLPSFQGIWIWLIGLGLLLARAALAQGPARALRQLLDIPSHAKLLLASYGRLKRAGRLLAILFGTMIVSWTSWQFLTFSMTEKKEDLAILLKTKTRWDLSLEQGVLAGITAMRDLAGLGDTVLLLLVISGVVFKRAADRWQMGLEGDEDGSQPPPSAWMTLSWCGAWLYALYRIVTMVVDRDGLPLSLGMSLECVIVPALALLSDALLMAWILTELRGPLRNRDEMDVDGMIGLIPGALLCCLLTLPARIVGLMVWLLVRHLPPGEVSSWCGMFLRGWGLAWVQVISFCGMVTIASMTRRSGRFREGIAGIWSVMKAEGGHLAGAVLLGSITCAVAGGVVYAILLALPIQGWVLTAADSYSHYATLLTGLILAGALVEIGHRAERISRVREQGELAGMSAPDERVMAHESPSSA
jgi:hypothetical protein